MSKNKSAADANISTTNENEASGEVIDIKVCPDERVGFDLSLIHI